MQRLRLVLTDEEYEALFHLAEREVRPLPDQARAVLRERLRQSGLLPEVVDQPEAVAHAR